MSWKSVQIRQELAEKIEEEIKKIDDGTISGFVTEAIHMQLQTLVDERIQQYLERNMESRMFEMQMQLLYSPKHIWVQKTLKGTVRLGVTKYFVKKVKGITYIKPCQVGTDISKGEAFAVAETPAWWFIRDLISPIDGKIVEINRDVIDDPVELSDNPYQWIVEVQTDDSPLQKVRSELLNFREYQELIARIEDLGHFPNDEEQDNILKMIMKGGEKSG